MNHIPPVDKSFKLLRRTVNHSFVKKPVVVSLGVHVVGALNFWPELRNQDAGIFGVMKRIATRMPPIDNTLFKEFYSFSVDFIRTRMKVCQLSPLDDLSLDKWLNDVSYRLNRKINLKKIGESKPFCDNSDYFVDGHFKHEPYVEPKFMRGIFSRVDFFKTKMGPYCFLIGKLFFGMIWFIKNVPMAQRADFINNRMFSFVNQLCSNDFSSFEATFVPTLMKIEIFFFSFCLEFRPESKEIIEMIRRTKTGNNRVIFKMFSFSLVGKRYSGEMDTSLSNSLMNLLFIVFLLHKSGHSMSFIDEHPPVVEGDDSGFCHDVSLPLNQSILVLLGANAKLLFHPNLADMQFCKIVFSDDTMDIVSDPLQAMLNFGYSGLKYLQSSRKVHDALIRAKSMSMLYTYPGCPVLKHLALYGLRVTQHVHDRMLLRVIDNWDDLYKRDMFLNVFHNRHSLVLDKKISMSSRFLVEEKFMVSVAIQIDIENYFDSLTIVQPLDVPHLSVFCDLKRQVHFRDYSRRVKYVDSSI